MYKRQQRDRDRETETETERQRETETETDRQAGRQTDRQTHNTDKDIHTDRQTRQTEDKAPSQCGTQTKVHNRYLSSLLTTILLDMPKSASLMAPRWSTRQFAACQPTTGGERKRGENT